MSSGEPADIPTLRGRTTVGCVNGKNVVLFATTGEVTTSKGETIRRSVSRYLKWEDDVSAEDAHSFSTPFNDLGIHTHQWYGSVKVRVVEWDEKKRSYPVVMIVNASLNEIFHCRLWLTDCREYVKLFVKGKYLQLENVAAFKEHEDDKESHLVAASGITTMKTSQGRTPLASLQKPSVKHNKSEREDSIAEQDQKKHRAEKEMPVAASNKVEETDTVSTPSTDDSCVEKSDSSRNTVAEGGAALSGGQRLGGDDDGSPQRSCAPDGNGCTERDFFAQRKAAAAAEARAKKAAGRFC